MVAPTCDFIVKGLSVVLIHTLCFHRFLTQWKQFILSCTKLNIQTEFCFQTLKENKKSIRFTFIRKQRQVSELVQRKIIYDVCLFCKHRPHSVFPGMGMNNQLLLSSCENDGSSETHYWDFRKCFHSFVYSSNSDLLNSLLALGTELGKGQTDRRLRQSCCLTAA